MRPGVIAGWGQMVATDVSATSARRRSRDSGASETARVTTMNLASGLCLGLLLAAICAAAPPGHAEGIPSGSYLASCSGAKVEGASLIARCPRVDGSEQHSALLNFDRCAGDIANDNGVLSCTFST